MPNAIDLDYLRIFGVSFIYELEGSLEFQSRHLDRCSCQNAPWDRCVVPKLDAVYERYASCTKDDDLWYARYIQYVFGHTSVSKHIGQGCRLCTLVCIALSRASRIHELSSGGQVHKLPASHTPYILICCRSSQLACVDFRAKELDHQLVWIGRGRCECMGTNERGKNIDIEAWSRKRPRRVVGTSTKINNAKIKYFSDKAPPLRFGICDYSIFPAHTNL